MVKNWIAATSLALTLAALSAGRDAAPVPNKVAAVPVTKVASSQTTASDYALAARCATEARDWFKSNFGDCSMTGSYTNHYNKTFNSCFVETTSVQNSMSSKSVVDVHENRDAGDYIYNGDTRKVMLCNIDDADCQNEIEWEMLARKYMTN